MSLLFIMIGDHYMNNLKKLRLEKNLTQRELAEKAELTFMHIYRLETNKVRFDGLSVKNARKIAKALDVSLEELMTEE